MKTLLILILLIALVAVAAFTRPSEGNFRYYYRQHQPAQIDGLIGKITGKPAADAFLQQTQYKNYVFWANIERDGTILYTGAFSHWFKR